MVQAIVLNSQSEVSVLTDSEGRFEFPALPESDMSLLVHKPGYFSGLELNPSNFEPEVVHLSADISNLSLLLLPEGLIAGHVATTKGDSVEDSPVRVFREVVSNGYRHWEVRGQASTDEDGQFRIVDLMPGRYLLATGPNVPSVRASRMRGPRKDGYGTLFYPGVADMESATPLVITGGQQLQTDFASKLEPGLSGVRHARWIFAGIGMGMQFPSRK